MRIAIVVFDEVEVLDACGPFEVFSVARRLLAPDGPDLQVTLVSAYADRTAVRARGGLRLTADVTRTDLPAVDLLLVPGGITTALEHDADFVAWLAGRRTTPVLASVCTGAFLLAQAGILTDQRVTTHWDDLAELAERWPGLTVLDGPRWVQDGDVFTSAGIAAGLDLALHLVDRVRPGLGRRVARQMDYPWQGADPVS